MLYNLEKLNLDGGFTEAQVVVQTWWASRLLPPCGMNTYEYFIWYWWC
jgi:hypothetical protein